MTCSNCGKRVDGHQESCPHCGRSTGSGLFQTSTVLISSGDTEGVYRSVEEVPAPLRTRLMKSTNGANSATILIADRRGREEIARAMKGTPAQRKLVDLFLQSDVSGSAVRLTRNAKIGLAVFLGLLLVAVIRFFFRL